MLISVSHSPDEKVDDWLLWKILLRCSIKPNHHFLLLISVKGVHGKIFVEGFEPFP